MIACEQKRARLLFTKRVSNVMLAVGVSKYDSRSYQQKPHNINNSNH